MKCNWRDFWDAPLWVIGDYLTVMRWEALGTPSSPRTEISDAPPGAEMETVTEVIEYQRAFS
jgi:hypothetical protein